MLLHFETSIITLEFNKVYKIFTELFFFLLNSHQERQHSHYDAIGY